MESVAHCLGQHYFLPHKCASTLVFTNLLGVHNLSSVYVSACEMSVYVLAQVN